MNARALPAAGAGSENDTRPGAVLSGAPQSTATEKGPGPDSSVACPRPSTSSVPGRPAARIEHGSSRDEINARRSRAKHLSIDRERPACGDAVDSDAQIGAAENGADRRDLRRPDRPRRQIHQTVVLGERQRDSPCGTTGIAVAASARRGPDAGRCGAGCADAASACVTNDARIAANVVHDPPHRVRLNAKSTDGAAPSDVSSARKKATGRAPERQPAPERTDDRSPA